MCNTPISNPHQQALEERSFSDKIEGKLNFMNVHVVNSTSNSKFCLELFQPQIFNLQVEIKHTIIWMDSWIFVGQ